MDTWNRRVTARREALGMSKSEFARRCGVSAPTVNDWENGDIRKIEAMNMLAICRALEVDPWWLMLGERGGKSPKREDFRPLSDETESLIKDVIRLEGQGGLPRKMLHIVRQMIALATESAEHKMYPTGTYRVAMREAREAEKALSLNLEGRHESGEHRRKAKGR